jgi:hypothetical protein
MAESNFLDGLTLEGIIAFLTAEAKRDSESGFNNELAYVLLSATPEVKDAVQHMFQYDQGKTSAFTYGVAVGWAHAQEMRQGETEPE